MGDDKIAVHDAQRQARHYKISGDMQRDVWFDGDTLLRLKLVGSDHSIIDSDLTEMASLPADDRCASKKRRQKCSYLRPPSARARSWRIGGRLFQPGFCAPLYAGDRHDISSPPL